MIECIDCMHILISLPGGDNAEIFQNIMLFLINVQAVFDLNMPITNIVCHWPGSTHDSCIFDNSALCSKFENNFIDGLLLGGGGYPCCHYLMTPVNNRVTEKEKNYNKAHIATRGKVEGMFGIWKQRFCCVCIPL